MNVIFRETNMDNERDNEALVVLLNEFMNRRNTAGTNTIDEGIVQKLKKLGTAKIYLGVY